MREAFLVARGGVIVTRAEVTMTIKSVHICRLLLPVVFVALLQGCASESGPKTAAVDSTTSPTPESPAVQAPLEPRYEATLAEGIDFRRAGYPNFIAEVSGMSGLEHWGRWTEAAAGPVAKFRFKQPLPQKFNLEISANAFGPNEGEPIRVRVGQVEKTFVVPKAVSNATYTLVFDSINGDTLEIVPPKPTSPAEQHVSGDPRKLGVGLISLKVKQ